MSDTTRAQLLGYLLGALDKAERNSCKEQLQYSPSLRHELAEMREKIRPLAVTRSDFTPPPGLASRTCQWVAAVMDAEITSAPVLGW